MKTSILAALATLLLTSTGYSRGVPDDVTISNLTYGGTGCPAGSVSENISDDFKAFTLLFDSFYAEAGPGISRREMRKFCQMNLTLEYPSGWSFALLDLSTRGYVSLDSRVTAKEKNSFYFQGQRTAGAFENNFVGPTDEDFEAYDVIPVDGLLWSPCGANRSLNIKTDIRLDNRRNRRGTGLITVDSVDGELWMTYGIVWREC